MPVLCGDDDDVDRDDRRSRNETDDDQTLIPLKETDETHDRDDRHRQDDAWAHMRKRAASTCATSNTSRRSGVDGAEIQH